jgi:hypothetical protein
LAFLVASFPLAFPPTTYTRSSSPVFVLHAPPIDTYIEKFIKAGSDIQKMKSLIHRQHGDCIGLIRIFLKQGKVAKNKAIRFTTK